jgi:hypothetical protein
MSHSSMSSVPLSIPELSFCELERRMRPGAYSEGGFLGQTESLEAVIAEDNQTLRKLGVSRGQIADGLENVLQCVLDQRHELLESNASEYWQREGEGRIPDLYHPQSVPHFTADNLPSTDVGYLVGDKLQVFITQSRGFQECPWGCDYEHWSSFDFLILNRRSGRYLTGPGLIVHLIRKHHFFEGLESPYRVDPTKAVQVLELVPNDLLLSIPDLESRMRPGAYLEEGFLGPSESLEAVLAKDRRTLEEAQVEYDQVADALERVLQSALDQRDELLDQIARTPPKAGKMRTALEIALGSASASQLDSLYSEFEKRDLHMPDLSQPESVPCFSLDNLPDLATGYLVEGTLQVFFAGHRVLQGCPWDCPPIPWACFDFLIVNRRSGEYITGPGMIVHLIREHQFFEGSESPYRVEPLRAIRVLERVLGESVFKGGQYGNSQMVRQEKR